MSRAKETRGEGRGPAAGRPEGNGNEKPPDPRRLRGRDGEEIARRYLRRRLYQIMETNYRSRYGELDIIARRGNIIAFIEVKARRDKRLGEPYESVGPRKQAQIRRMASIWLAEHQHDEKIGDYDFRFDVISVMLNEEGAAASIEHIKDAFQ